MKTTFINAESKSAFRTTIKKQTFSNNKYQAIKLNKYLINICKKKEFKHILVFYPLTNEPDIKPLILWLKKQHNKEILLPVINGLNFKMLPFAYPLRKNKFNILEPNLTKTRLLKLDLAIIPVLGIDNKFRRIGMGKGMYDRTFENLKTYKIFISQNLNIANRSICEKFDINANEYISYKYKIKRNKNAFNNNFFNNLCSFSRIRRLSNL